MIAQEYRIAYHCPDVKGLPSAGSGAAVDGSTASMILSDTDIAEYLRQGRIVVLPGLAQSDIRPAGIRLHLAAEILVPKPSGAVSLSEASAAGFEPVTIGDGGYPLRPGQFVLGATVERVQVPPDIVCHLEGRSTVARLGLSVHCTSGIVDGGHDQPECVVLEMVNHGPFDLTLKAGDAVAMLVFDRLTGPIGGRYSSVYGGQSTVAPPK